MEVKVNPYEALSYHDKNRWVIVYPAYLNAKKTLVQGRRLSKAKAVDNPLCSEIRDVCTSLELPVDIEPKHYPRELARDPIHSGRVRVQIKNDDGTPCNETISNKRELFVVVADLIPKLKSRQGGRSGGAEGGGSGSSGGGAGSGGGGSSSRKKKGKRK